MKTLIYFAIHLLYKMGKYKNKRDNFCIMAMWPGHLKHHITSFKQFYKVLYLVQLKILPLFDLRPTLDIGPRLDTRCTCDVTLSSLCIELKV